MQTLQSEFKNVPTDASLICSSTTLPLNRDERTSVVGKVLDCNNPEVIEYNICGKKSTKDDPFRMHHINQKSEGGTDRAEDLALVHKSCHKKFHEKKLFHRLKKAKEYKAETFMSIIAAKFKEALDCEITFGYETKTKRDALGLEKSHINDAFVIAGGTDQKRCKPYRIEQKRINNRTLQTNRKGFKPSIRKQRHSIQNRDFVWVERKKYLCGDTHSF